MCAVRWVLGVQMGDPLASKKPFLEQMGSTNIFIWLKQNPNR